MSIQTKQVTTMAFMFIKDTPYNTFAQQRCKSQSDGNNVIDRIRRHRIAEPLHPTNQMMAIKCSTMVIWNINYPQTT
jgi:hypothetical protein